MKLFSSFFLFLFTSLCYAQNYCNYENRYLDSVFSTVEITQDILFGNADPYNPFVSSLDLFLDFYEAQGDTAHARPLIVHAFGGSFLTGSRTGDDIPYWAQEYVEKGYVFASIDYRLGFNPLDGGSIERAAYRCAQDYSAALRFLVDNASLYRIDTNNIIVTGNSSGSIGSMILLFMNESDRPNSTFGTILEPNDLGCFNCSGNSNNNNQKIDVKACINLWGAVLDTNFIDLMTDSADFRPTISFHGDADAVVPYQSGYPFSLPLFPFMYGSESIHFRLDNENIPNQFVSFPGFPHEPEQAYPWVSDTIISKASKFIFPYVYGDTARILGDHKVCKDSITQIFAENHIGSSYCWYTPGAVIIGDSLNEVQVRFDSIGLYTIYLTEVDYKGLTKVDSFEIEVQFPPSSMLDYSGLDGLIQLTLLNNTITQASWNFGNGFLSNVLNPNHQFQDTGLYVIQVQMLNEFCKADTSYSIISNKCAEASYSYVVVDSNLLLYNESSFADAIQWIDFEGSFLTGDTVGFPLNSDDNFVFILIASNRFCNDTVQADLEIDFCSNALATYSTNGLDASFFEESFNGYFYLWNFGDGNISSLPNPVHQYSSSGQYQVSLIVTSLQGCSDTLYFDLNLENVGTSISNFKEQFIFYPNPGDGIIYFEGAIDQEMSIEIYNLIGEKLYAGPLYLENHVLANKSDGLYVIKIIDDKESFTFPVIKQ